MFSTVRGHQWSPVSKVLVGFRFGLWHYFYMHICFNLSIVVLAVCLGQLSSWEENNFDPVLNFKLVPPKSFSLLLIFMIASFFFPAEENPPHSMLLQQPCFRMVMMDCGQLFFAKMFCYGEENFLSLCFSLPNMPKGGFKIFDIFCLNVIS